VNVRRGDGTFSSGAEFIYRFVTIDNSFKGDRLTKLVAFHVDAHKSRGFPGDAAETFIVAVFHDGFVDCPRVAAIDLAHAPAGEGGRGGRGKGGGGGWQGARRWQGGRGIARSLPDKW